MAETYAQAALDVEVGNKTGIHIAHPFREIDIPVYAKDPLCIEQVMQLTHKQLGIQPSISYEMDAD